MIIRIYFLILLFIVPIISSYSQDLEDIVSELQEELQLNDDQAEQLSAALVKYSQEMNTELAKHEDAEEPDTRAMIGDIKKAQDNYRNELSNILTDEQYDAYLNYVDKVMKEMFGDIAEIKLMDLQPVLDLSDEQITQLNPVLGEGMLGMVKVVFEYGDKKMNKRTKIKMGKKLKKIQSKTDSGVKEILSPEQYEKYQEYKEAKKNK
ncbi:MAG: hypothetical protein ACE1ZQ_11870 [Ignavibacteriaceae bacterium]